MFVYSSVHSLGLDLPHILFSITFLTETEIYRVASFTADFGPYFILMFTRPVREMCCTNDMSTTFGVWPAPAWITTALGGLLLSHDLVFTDGSLTQYISKISVFLKHRRGLFLNFSFSVGFICNVF